MKLSFASKTLFVGVLVILFSPISKAAAFCSSYKTSMGEVVITGLQPGKQYEVQYLSNDKQKGAIISIANPCGEAVIMGGATYQELTVDSQIVIPSSLPTYNNSGCNAIHPTCTNK